MFFIKLLSFVLCATLCFVLFWIVFWIVVFLAKLVNHIKKHIVWLRKDKISRLTLYPAQKKYRKEAVNTGYSVGGHYRSAVYYHYKYKDVFDGTYRKVIVEFEDGKKIKVNVKEEGLLYQQFEEQTLPQRIMKA